MRVKERMTPKSLHGIDPDMISLIFEVFWDNFLNEYTVATINPYSGKVSNPLTYEDLKSMFPKFADKLIWVFAFADEKFDLTFSDVIFLKTGQIFVYDERGNLIKTFNEEVNKDMKYKIQEDIRLTDEIVLEAGDKIRVVENRKEDILEKALDQIMKIQMSQLPSQSGSNQTYVLGTEIGRVLNDFMLKYFDSGGQDMLLQGIMKGLSI